MSKRPTKPPAARRVQANKYDKILKENLRRAIPAVLLHVVGVSVTRLQAVSVELQHTRERKADFIGIATDAAGTQSVLHLEFQVRNDPKMLQRMLEYRTMLRRRYPGFSVMQYVVFLGKSAPRMVSEINDPDLAYRYHLKWMQEADCRKFLDSDRAEEVLLAVLADFGAASPRQVADEIVLKLKAKAETELEFHRFTEQLRILPNIRNLQPLINLIMEKISRFFVEERDPLFRKGKLEGKLEGEILKARIFVENLLEEGIYTPEKIASLADVSLEFVLAVKADMDAGQRKQS